MIKPNYMKNRLFEIYSYILLIGLILVSCQERGVGVGTTNAIDISINLDLNKPLKYNDLFKSIQYIPLETESRSLIQSIDKLFVTDSGFLIFDSKQMNILLFNKDGSFIRQIGQKGTGNNEYVYWNDIFFEKSTQLIYAHERYQNRIYVYNLSGVLVNKTKKSRYYFSSFVKSRSGFWVYSCFKKPYNYDGYNLLLLDDSLQNVKASFFPQKEFVNATTLSTFFTDNNENSYFFYPSGNTIFKLEQEVPIPYCKVDFGKHTLPYNSILQISNSAEYENLVSNHNYLGDIKSFKTNGKFIYFSFCGTDYNKPVNNYNCLYNVSKDKTYLYENPFIESLKYPVSSMLLQISGELLIYALYPIVLSGDSFTMLSKDVGKQISEESNPILVIVKSK